MDCNYCCFWKLGRLTGFQSSFWLFVTIHIQLKLHSWLPLYNGHFFWRTVPTLTLVSTSLQQSPLYNGHFLLSPRWLWSVEQNTRHANGHARDWWREMGEAGKKIFFPSRAAALVSRVSRLRFSHARALLSLNLKKKRDCSPCILEGSTVMRTRHICLTWSCDFAIHKKFLKFHSEWGHTIGINNNEQDYRDTAFSRRNNWITDQFRFLGNWPPTPPLSQHYHLLPSLGRNLIDPT